MSTCDNQQRISAYHDGELADDQAAELEKHLAECEHCTGQLRQLQAMSQLFGSAAEAVRVPPGAMLRWRSSVPCRRDRVIVRMTEMLSAAAAAILIICSAAVWQHLSASASRPASPPAWESVAVKTTAGPTRTSAGQLSSGPELPPDVQLANAIMGSSSDYRRGQR